MKSATRNYINHKSVVIVMKIDYDYFYSMKLKNQNNSSFKESKLSYASVLQDMIKNSGIKPGNYAEPLAHLDYKTELNLKNKALQFYWKETDLKGSPGQIIPSPKERFYRTTTKRKVIISKGRLLLSIGSKPEFSGEVFRSLLEPREHAVIYEFLHTKLNEPAYRLAGNSLNYLIIRGSYSEFSVIFNVHTLNADIVRKLKSLSELIKAIDVNIVSAFIYLDPTRSEYYLENERPAGVVSMKKLFGPDKLFLKFNDKKYSYHPTSFSQINESIIPDLLSEAKRMLNPDKTARLYDLYCGFGLFSLFMAGELNTTTGIEIEGEAINSAILNTSFHPQKNRIKFITGNITGENLEELLPLPGSNELFLLDPPRQGTERGVIAAIAARKPLRVLHIFCGIEEIKRETQQWAKYGYNIKEIQPLDMFPGTPNLEILILLGDASTGKKD